MGYKERFKMNELEHEIAAEEEDMMKNMTPAERRQHLQDLVDAEIAAEKMRKNR